MTLPNVTPLEKNIEVWKGGKWERTFHFEGIDFTGCTVAAYVRKKALNSSELIITPVVSFYSSDPTLGKITVTIDDSVSNVYVDRGYWSLVITDSLSNAFPWIVGEVIFRDYP